MNKRDLFADDFFERHDFLFKLRIVIARSLKIKTKEAKEFLENIKDEDDKSILHKLDMMQVVKQVPELTDKYVNQLVKGTYGNFSKLFEREKIEPKCERYLDVGCNEGTMTRCISKYFGIEKDSTFGIDIVDSVYQKNKEYLIFQIYNGLSIPFDDNHFDVISVFQVFHHVGVNNVIGEYDEQKLHLLIKDIVRVMKNGGRLFVKEHNCDSNLMVKLIDIEHILFDMRYNKGRQGMGTGKYKTQQDWHNLLATFGFNLTTVFIDDTSDPTNSFFSVYILNK